MEKKLYYFGCYNRIGHYWFGEGGGELYNSDKTKLPINKNVIDFVDGFFPPPQWKNGYLESIIGNVRFVAWWDLSLDNRPGSNSTLMGYGYDSAEDMLNDAVIKFPAVMNRQPRPERYLAIDKSTL